MNWPAGALAALLLAMSMLALAGARRASRARVAAARLQVTEAGGFRVDGLRMPAPRLVVALTATATGLALGGPGLAAVLLAASTGGHAVLRAAARRRRDARAEAALPDVLEAIARSLRSGASLRLALDEAVAAAGPLADDLRRITAETAHGSDVAAALERWRVARPLPGVHLAVSALCLGLEAGGAQAHAVDGVAATLRQQHGVTAEARALGAQARMSALVIAVSPVLFCVLASTTDARTARFLLRTGTGQLLLAGGIALDAVGALWMTWLTQVRA
jgi:tight adherence protein B